MPKIAELTREGEQRNMIKYYWKKTKDKTLLEELQDERVKMHSLGTFHGIKDPKRADVVADPVFKAGLYASAIIDKLRAITKQRMTATLVGLEKGMAKKFPNGSTANNLQDFNKCKIKNMFTLATADADIDTEVVVLGVAGSNEYQSNKIQVVQTSFDKFVSWMKSEMNSDQESIFY